MEKYYNIHDIVRFKIISDGFNWKFNNIYGAYENFEVANIGDLDFVVYLGEFMPCNKNCYIVDNKYFIRKGYFYCKKDSYKLTNWKFEITGLEDKELIVRIFSNLPGYMWMSGFIIDFLIHYKLNEKSYSIIHASCVSKDNKGYLFSGRGGSGKTTIATSLLERGVKILGDNFVVLYEGKVLSYLSPLNIFTYNLTPLIKRSLSTKERAVLNLKEMIYKINRGYVKIFSKLNLKEIYPELIADKTELDKIFLILPKKELKEIQIEKIRREKLIEHLVSNQMLDTLMFLPYIFEYSYVFPDSGLATYWDKYRENLNSNLPNDKLLFRVEVPEKYTSYILEKLQEVINEGSIELQHS